MDNDIVSFLKIQLEEKDKQINFLQDLIKNLMRNNYEN